MESGNFRCSFGTTLYGHELAHLRTLLQALLDQLGQHLKASFALVERSVEFDFELFRRGAVAAQVTLHTDEADHQQLTFPMEIDPLQLSTCVSQIDAILARFPLTVTTTSGPDEEISPG